MTTREYLEAAIRAADVAGRFCPQAVSKELKMTKPQMRMMGANLVSMKLVVAGKGMWQLVGVAAEMAQAVRG